MMAHSNHLITQNTCLGCVTMTSDLTEAQKNVVSTLGELQKVIATLDGCSQRAPVKHVREN